MIQILWQAVSQNCPSLNTILVILFFGSIAASIFGIIWVNYLSPHRHEVTDEEKRYFDTYF